MWQIDNDFTPFIALYWSFLMNYLTVKNTVKVVDKYQFNESEITKYNDGKTGSIKWKKFTLCIGRPRMMWRSGVLSFRAKINIYTTICNRNVAIRNKDSDHFEMAESLVDRAVPEDLQNQKPPLFCLWLPTWLPSCWVDSRRLQLPKG